MALREAFGTRWQVLRQRRDELREPRRRQPGVHPVLREEAGGGAVLVDPPLDRADDEAGVLVREPAPQRVALDVGVPGGAEHVPELGQLVAHRIGDLAIQHRAVHRQGRAQPSGGHPGVVHGVVVPVPHAGDRGEQPLGLGGDVRLHDLARGSHLSSLARRPASREQPRRHAIASRSPGGPSRESLVCWRSFATRR